MKEYESVGQFSPIDNLAEKFFRNLKQKQLFPNCWVIPGESEFISFHYFLFCLGSLAEQENRIVAHMVFHSLAYQLRSI